MAGSPSRRLTQDEIERIVELRLRGQSIRQTAAAIPTTTNSVQKHWNAYLEERRKEFSAETDQMRVLLIQRLLGIANRAATAAAQADEPAQAKYLAEERQALVALAKFFEGPIQVEHSGGIGFTTIRIVETVDDEDT